MFFKTRFCFPIIYPPKRFPIISWFLHEIPALSVYQICPSKWLSNPWWRRGGLKMKNDGDGWTMVVAYSDRPPHSSLCRAATMLHERETLLIKTRPNDLKMRAVSQVWQRETGGVSYRDALLIILNINTRVTRSLQKLSTAQVSHVCIVQWTWQNRLTFLQRKIMNQLHF